MKKTSDVPIVSTLEDLHGEKRTKEDLELFRSGLPPKLPINLEHDMGRPTTSYIENFRVVRVPGTDSDWMLIGDRFDDGDAPEDPSLGGISFSFSTPISQNTEGETAFTIYLPFPHYRDEALLDRLHRIDLPLGFGRWQKKDLAPDAIGYIVSAIILLIGPEWTRLYEERVRPFLANLLPSLEKAQDGVAYDYHQIVTDSNGHRTRLIFVSEHADWVASLRPDRIQHGLQVAIGFLSESEFSKVKPISQLRLRFNPAINNYAVVVVQYEDGEHITLQR